MSASTPSSSRKSRLRGIAGYALGLAIIGFIALALRKEAGAIHGAHLVLSPARLALSMAGGLLASILSAWSWVATLRALEAPSTFRAASRVWYTSMAARYIPGTIPGVLVRIYLTEETGVPRPLAAAATALDWALWLDSALLAAAFTTPWWVQGLAGDSLLGGISPYWLLLLVLPALLAIHPRAIAFLVRKAAKRTAGEVTVSPGYGTILRLLLIYLLKWIFYGLSLSAVLPAAGGSLSPWLSLPGATVAFAVGWVAGFISPFSPGGIGVREGVIVGLLHGQGSLALEAALLSRLMTTLAEILCWLWATVDRRRATGH